MGNPHHLAHWYSTAAYLYILGLDALALAWEYLRRHPDYRLDWLRRARRPDAGQRWGLRLLEDPALDARDAHPAWLPGHAAVVQLYPGYFTHVANGVRSGASRRGFERARPRCWPQPWV